MGNSALSQLSHVNIFTILLKKTFQLFVSGVFCNFKKSLSENAAIPEKCIGLFHKIFHNPPVEDINKNSKLYPPSPSEKNIDGNPGDMPKNEKKNKNKKKNGLMERSRKFLEIPFERKPKEVTYKKLILSIWETIFFWKSP